MYVNDEQTDWDEHLPFVMHAYRTSVHDVTEVTPFFAMYGRQCRGLNDLTNAEMLPEGSGDPKHYSTELAQRMEQITQRVRANIQRAQQARLERLNARQRPHGFEVDDMVWLFKLRKPRRRQLVDGVPLITAHSVKLAPHWRGPFRIRVFLDPSNVELESMNGRAYKGAVHVSRLKPFNIADGRGVTRHKKPSGPIPLTDEVMDQLSGEVRREVREHVDDLARRAERQQELRQLAERTETPPSVRNEPTAQSAVARNGEDDNVVSQPAVPAMAKRQREAGESEVEQPAPAKQPKAPRKKASTGKEKAPRSRKDPSYEVEAVTGSRLKEGVKQYKVRWAGYKDHETWEYAENLDHCDDLIAAYHATDSFRCHHCDEKMLSRSGLKAHLRSHKLAGDI